jgi:hypothetical protein
MPVRDATTALSERMAAADLDSDVSGGESGDDEL